MTKVIIVHIPRPDLPGRHRARVRTMRTISTERLAKNGRRTQPGRHRATGAPETWPILNTEPPPKRAL